MSRVIIAPYFFFKLRRNDYVQARGGLNFAIFRKKGAAGLLWQGL